MKSFNLEVDSMARMRGSPPQIANEIKAKCTLTIRDMNGRTSQMILYKENDGKLVFPRALVNGKVPIKNSPLWEIGLGLKFKKKLRDYQKPIVDKIIQAYQEGFYGGIVHAGTGTGKSIIALKFLCEIDAKACIIVPLSRIVEQWVNYILEFTNIKEHEIGYIWQNNIDFKDKKVVIAMLPSLASRLEDYGEELYKSFYTTIWDEGHFLGARTFSQVVPLFHDKFRLMLSATPRRKDGAEHVFKYHIGRVIVKFDKVLLKPKVVRVVYSNIKLRDGSFTYGKRFSRGSFIKTLSSILERNKIIVKYIVKAYRKGRRIIVMGDRIQQLKTIEKLLSLEGIRVSKYYDKYKQTDEQVILATYGSLGVAVDLPDRDTLIIATPRSDIEQAVGRILRPLPDKKNPVVVDIVDALSEKMKAGWRAREKYYKKVGAEVITKVIRSVK